MKLALFRLQLLVIFLPLVGWSQSRTMLKHQISVSYDDTLLNHPLLFSKGLNTRYHRTLIQKKLHSLSALSSFGFVSTPNIDNRLIIGLGAEYSLYFLKRLSLASGLQSNYVLTILDYDIFEYNADGNLEKKGNLIHKFSPSMHLTLLADILRRDKINLALFLETRLTRLNESYKRKFLEGYVPTISIGLKSKF
jgi:hypothetical protein